MKLIGNILWFIFGGFISAVCWIVAGCLCCITIIGIPVGLQCFKLSSMSLWPFGKAVVYGDGTVSFFANLIWVIIFGWEMALWNAIVGLLWCVTIIGIPFGKQFFKLAKLSLLPFGANIIEAVS